MNDYILSMKVLLIVLGSIVVLIPLIFILIEMVVERLPEDHRFVMWWRRHVVGVSDDDLF